MQVIVKRTLKDKCAQVKELLDDVEEIIYLKNNLNLLRHEESKTEVLESIPMFCEKYYATYLELLAYSTTTQKVLKHNQKIIQKQKINIDVRKRKQLREIQLFLEGLDKILLQIEDIFLTHLLTEEIEVE